jgi:uncharacterized membrane-anchored protein YitT (DUF2179 family)
MRTLKKGMTYLVIILAACVGALNYQLFVFPNQFAPSGLNGICTMIQHVFGISVGYMSLLVNIPLAIIVFFKVSKSLALRSMVYVGVFSVMLLLLERVDLSGIAYDTASSAILGPLVAGIINGGIYAALVSAGAYSGGTDFISAIVHKYHPDKSVLAMSFSINVFIAIASYFVYGYQMEPVILCIIYSFASSTVGERLQKSGREAVCFEIITDYPEEISQEIIKKFHHTTTLIPAKGMYSGRETNMLICVVNKTQATAISRIIRKYPRTFAVMDLVSEVMGNFANLSGDNNPVKVMLDSGDGKTL